MPTIRISGYPLEESLTFENTPVDEYFDEFHWLLTRAQADLLLTAWRDAETYADDLARAYHYNHLGVFVTALHMDHELNNSERESAVVADDFDLYPTSQMPFDFLVELIA